MRKGAIVLASLGMDRATQICKYLPQETVKQLAEEISKLGVVDPQEQKEVLDGFAAAAQHILSLGGIDYAQALLSEVTGGTAKLDETFSSELERLQALADSEPHVLWRNIQTETPQMIAVIISQLPPAKAAEILGYMNERKRGEVAYRAANLGPLAPGALAALSARVEGKVVQPADSEEETTTSGLEFLLEIFEHVDRSSEKQILQLLSDIDKEFAEQVDENLVTFESLFDLDDIFLQILLRQAESATLALALKGVADKYKQRVMENLSERAQQVLTEELALLGPVKGTDVDAAQKQITNLARELAESGEISLRKEEEEYIG